MTTHLTIPRSHEIRAELHRRRMAVNLGQREVCELLGWHQSTFSERESGKRRTTLEQLDAWVDALVQLGA